jgi:hypothetical protein
MSRALALATAAWLGLTGYASANPWLVDYSQPGGTAQPPIHVQFDTPTFLTVDSVSTFTLNSFATLAFGYSLDSSSCTASSGVSITHSPGPCDAWVAPFEGASHFASSQDLAPSTNPLIWSNVDGGVLTFTDLGSTGVPEPTSLALLGAGLLGLGTVVHRRRNG